MKKLLVLTAAALAFAGSASAAIKSQVITYKQGGTTCEGYLAWDDSIKEKRPGVLVVPDWMGMTDIARKEADDVAALGYVAFAADIYGKNVRPQNQDEAGKQAGIYKSDRKLMRARAAAALAELKKSTAVDPQKIAAIGFCFGGTTVLELARSGADIKGTVVFHGGLSTPTPEDAKNIKGKVLALQGGDDPYVPLEERNAFADEMRKGKVDWELVQYGNTVHSYTITNAGNDASKGAAYNKQSADRAWVAMQDFFKEIFGATAR